MSAPSASFLTLGFLVGLFVLCSDARADVTIGAQNKNPRSLCVADETIVFSCALKRQRVVSVCASRGLSANDGYVQYRLGTPSKLEIAVPMAAANSLVEPLTWRSAVRSHSVMYAGGGGSYLRFNEARYSYVTYAATGRGWIEKQGIMVLKDEKLLAVHKCAGKFTSSMGEAFFRAANIVEDAEELELPSGDERRVDRARK